MVYLAIGGRESQSEPAVLVIARAYMGCNYLKIDCLLLHVMNTWFRMLIEWLKLVPFHNSHTKYHSGRVAWLPGKFYCPCAIPLRGHGSSFLTFRERKLLILGHTSP